MPVASLRPYQWYDPGNIKNPGKKAWDKPEIKEEIEVKLPPVITTKPEAQPDIELKNEVIKRPEFVPKPLPPVRSDKKYRQLEAKLNKLREEIRIEAERVEAETIEEILQIVSFLD